jgi:hypothetical protein
MSFLCSGRATRHSAPSVDQGIPITEDDERMLVGLAVSWSGHDAYYISFLPDGAGKQFFVDYQQKIIENKVKDLCNLNKVSLLTLLF